MDRESSGQRGNPVLKKRESSHGPSESRSRVRSSLRFSSPPTISFQEGLGHWGIDVGAAALLVHIIAAIPHHIHRIIGSILPRPGSLHGRHVDLGIVGFSPTTPLSSVRVQVVPLSTRSSQAISVQFLLHTLIKTQSPVSAFSPFGRWRVAVLSPRCVDMIMDALQRPHIGLRCGTGIVYSYGVLVLGITYPYLSTGRILRRSESVMCATNLSSYLALGVKLDPVKFQATSMVLGAPTEWPR